jgi:alkaline phosphatase D
VARKLTRRGFVASVAALAGATVAGSVLGACDNAMSDPFTLGVASGEPLPDGFVLWTRLAPRPLTGGGMPDRVVPVHWEVATDERFRHIVRRGTALAHPSLAHSVHIEVTGMRPAAVYWYRFKAGPKLSPIGRTSTAPTSGTSPQCLRFAFASCQNYEHGYYAAYANMASEDLDFVLHLGDYIYEAASHRVGRRMHDESECITLPQYRNRYALYKSDPDLQRAHASFPFVVTTDDHEVEDNYAALEPKAETDTPDPRSFARRRQHAYRAYWEHMPLRYSSMPRGGRMALYRRLAFGDLAEITMLDTRQYRSDQPCGDGVKPHCAASLDPGATLTGRHQERWLMNRLARSRASWNIVGQQTLMAQLSLGPDPERFFPMDQWDGYPAARHRLLTFLDRRRISNPVFLSGDTHASWVNELKTDFDDEDGAAVGVEFGGPSITSEAPPNFVSRVEAALRDNGHIRFFNGNLHGYVRCEVRRKELQADFRVVPTVRQPDARTYTLASFTVGTGSPTPHRTA